MNLLPFSLKLRSSVKMQVLLDGLLPIWVPHPSWLQWMNEARLFFADRMVQKQHSDDAHEPWLHFQLQEQQETLRPMLLQQYPHHSRMASRKGASPRKIANPHATSCWPLSYHLQGEAEVQWLHWDGQIICDKYLGYQSSESFDWIFFLACSMSKCALQKWIVVKATAGSWHISAHQWNEWEEWPRNAEACKKWN